MTDQREMTRLTNIKCHDTNRHLSLLLTVTSLVPSCSYECADPQASMSVSNDFSIRVGRSRREGSKAEMKKKQ